MSKCRGIRSQHKSVLFTLIQKFNKDVDPSKPYSTRDDIIVVTDEAHRTQYGRLSLNLRNALPNASFIGFTGTPLFKDDEITRRVFGEYLSTYDFKRAVDDKATVPLFYDARGEKLQIATTDLNERIAAKLEELEIDDIDVQQRLERELKREYHIITDGHRLERIAADFVEHYSTGWETGKAMLVCIDKVTCARMHALIADRWQERITQLEKQLSSASDEQELIFRERQLAWMRETLMAVVVSEEQGEVDKFSKWGIDIKPHRKLMKEGFELDDGKRLDMESAFKREAHPFRVAIVCAMWLTGFDVPSLSTLYLDKPLKAHTLMQAIARANRINEGKNNGLIVDYCGILKNLRKALATFAAGSEGDGTEDDPARPNEELLAEMAEAIDLVRDYLSEHDFKLADITEKTGFARNAAIVAAKEAINANDQTRKRFEIQAREVFKKFKACLTIPGVNDFRNDVGAINIIYKSLQKDRDQADISDLIRQLHEAMDGAIASQGMPQKEDHTVYDISSIDFDLLRREFERSPAKKTTVQNLKQVIENKLAKLLAQNPLRTNFQQHYEEIVAAYNSEKDQQTIEHSFNVLSKFLEALTDEESRAIREGLDQETLAIFDLMKKPDLDKKGINQIKKIAKELLETLKKEKLRIENWREKESTRDAVQIAIRDFLWDEKTGLPVDTYNEDDVIFKAGEIYKHVFTAYPSLPSPLF